MPKPHALLRAGFPYVKTLGTKYLTDQPTDLAFGKEGRLYLLTWAPIKIINYDEEDLGQMGVRNQDIREPLEDHHLVWPHTIIVDSDENVYVSDESVHRITAFSKDGEFLGHWGEHGSADGQLDRPAGIVFDADENMYVVDSLNHRIQKFTKDGKFLMNWGSFGDGDGEFNMPWGIAIDADGDVYVSDWRNDRIQKFTPGGEFVFKFGKSGKGEGQLDRPMGLDVDKDFDIYVVDRPNRVQLFSPEGRYVQRFLGDATISKSALERMWTMKLALRLREMTDLEPQKLFTGPRSVQVDDDGRMWVCDYQKFRIQIYQKEAYRLEEQDLAPALRAPTLSSN